MLRPPHVHARGAAGNGLNHSCRALLSGVKPSEKAKRHPLSRRERASFTNPSQCLDGMLARVFQALTVPSGKPSPSDTEVTPPSPSNISATDFMPNILRKADARQDNSLRLADRISAWCVAWNGMIVYDRPENGEGSRRRPTRPAPLPSLTGPIRATKMA